MAEIVNFYAVAHSQGKTTCALALAKRLADHNKVLLVELDYVKPSVALSTQITHDVKNINEYVQQTVQKGSYDFSSYVLTKERLVSMADRDRKKLYSDLPEQLDYLIFPFGFEEENFPTLLEVGDEQFAETYIQNMMVALKMSSYQHVICMLPTELDSIFCFEVLNHADKIVNVVTPSATRLFENKKMKNLLFTHLPHVKEKWIDIVNMTSSKISEAEYRRFLDEQAILIPYDEDRQVEELDLQFASTIMIEKMKQVAKKMGIELPPNVPKKRSFFARG